MEPAIEIKANLTRCLKDLRLATVRNIYEDEAQPLQQSIDWFIIVSYWN